MLGLRARRVLLSQLSGDLCPRNASRLGIHTEEYVLKDYRLLCQAQEVTIGVLACRGVGGGLLFNTSPGKVHIEEEEKNSQANYRWL